MSIDITRLIDSNITIIGKCNTSCREQAVEFAINEIQIASSYLDTKYIGVKNYAHFGDQREDHSYGMCPRHGSIVFEIRKKDRDNPHTGNDIYYLLVARDNPGISIGDLVNDKIRLDSEIKKVDSLIAMLLEVKC